MCRGADPDDNNPIYFEVFDVDDLEACKELCAGTSDCVGVESIGRRCEVWTRPAGIQATREVAGYQCLELVTFSLVDGGGSACRGTSAGDNMPEYYEVFTEPTLEDCQQRCAAKLHRYKSLEHSNLGFCEHYYRRFSVLPVRKPTTFDVLDRSCGIHLEYHWI